MKYEVCIDNFSVWQGNAETGIDALVEARQANPTLDLSDAYVNTLGEAN